MTGGTLRRPSDEEYFVAPWSEGFLQGDVFKDVPVGFASPPDAVVMAEGERRFISGPFDAGDAMLISPSCAIAAQGATATAGMYAHPVRTLVPIRPVAELLEGGAVTEQNVALLRADRLVNYLYLPAFGDRPEGAALLYMPISMHHEVISEERMAQLTGPAFWQLRVKLMLFYGSFLLDPTELGEPPQPTARTR